MQRNRRMIKYSQRENIAQDRNSASLVLRHDVVPIQFKNRLRILSFYDKIYIKEYDTCKRKAKEEAFDSWYHILNMRKKEVIR